MSLVLVSFHSEGVTHDERPIRHRLRYAFAPRTKNLLRLDALPALEVVQKYLEKMSAGEMT